MTGSTAAQRGFIRRWLRRGWRAFKWLTLLLLVCAIIYIAWTNHRGRVAIDRAIGELEKRNISVGMEAWEQQRRGISDEQLSQLYDKWLTRRFVAPPDNGALVYEAAFILQNRVRDPDSDLPYVGYLRMDPPQPCEQIHPELLRQMDDAMRRHAGIFELLAEARTMPQFDFAIDPMRIDMSDRQVLGGLRGALDLLKFACLHAQAHDDTQQVTESLTSMFALAASTRDEPGMLVAFVRMSLFAHGLKAMKDALSRVELSPSQLMRLETPLHQRLAGDVITPAIEADLASSHEQLQTLDLVDVLVQGRAMSRLIAQVQTRFAEAFGATEQQPLPPRRTWADQLGMLWVALCPGHYELAATEQLDAIIAAYDNLPTITGQESDVSPSVAAFVRTETQLRASCSTAVAALAVERYRMEHGAWPDSLEDVDAVIPADPYSGQSLLYKRLNDGVVLYTVGANGEDDGGMTRLDPGGSYDADDWNFRLYDPAIRNSKPPVRRTREAAERERQQSMEEMREMLGR
jgi:hypothetical protein